MSGGENALDLAAGRLERAIAELEKRLAQRQAPPGEGLFDQDRGQMAVQLEDSRRRERDLEAAGAEASAALGRAIVEFRAALNGSAPQSAAPAEH